MTEKIPGPRGLPFVGNLLDLKHEEGVLKAFEQMADVYGPIYKLSIAGKKVVVVSSTQLMLEFTDEKQFAKAPPPGLGQGKGAQGLFVAMSENPDWIQGWFRISFLGSDQLTIQDIRY